MQQRARETQSAIIEAAIKEFARTGYEGASTRAVARNAGVQHTLVTYHFKNKEGLWRAALTSLFDERIEALETRLQGLRGVDDLTKLRLTCEEFIRISARNLDFHRIMGDVALVPSEQLEWLLGQYLHRLLDSRFELIRSAQAQGRFIQGDPVHVWYIFVGAVTRIFMLEAEVERLMGRSPSDPDFIDEHVRLCMAMFFIDEVATSPRRAASGRR